MGAGFFKGQTFRIHLLTIFLSILFIICGALVTINVYMGRDAAITVAERHMGTAIESISERTQGLFREIQTFVRTASAMRALSMPPGVDGHVMLPMLLEAIHSLNDVDGMFIGYADGSFLHLVDLADAPAWRERLQAPAEASLAVRTILTDENGKRISRWTFFNADERFVADGPTEEASYDPRGRPWYKAALDVDGLAWSAPYVFATTGQVGLTVSRLVEGGGAVIGVDITLDQLSQFLGQQKISRSSVAAIFNRSGNLLVHPQLKDFTFSNIQTPYGQSTAIIIADNDDHLMKSVYDLNRENGWIKSPSYAFSVDGENYIGSSLPLPSEIGNGMVLTISAPISEITANVDKITRVTLFFSLLIVLVSIPLVAYVARSVSQSLTALAAEAERLPLMDNSAPARVSSRIREIGKLAEALATSKAALNTFGRYVPKSLVRKIVQSGEEPVLGGERRMATFLFTDIEGFTTISEEIRPEELIERLSRYFSHISHVIHDNGGTINKYIGDAVMAMWNAPELCDNHAAAACRAALQARDIVERFNHDLIAAGEPPFRTRFGVHCGDVVVGHIGDNDHIEYTALGDAVNVSARLEGLNKTYGTTILVSEAVVAELGDEFETRFVAAVAPKGRAAEVRVYELVSARSVVASVSMGAAV
ncbi:adenylate/guanylate cyclase domain-containing protein [Insolitispirillum peregrinum]|uniref:Adenylate cyclase n=1 Tax=Insolitispirillum peregrinum TaxID=80876 RepID=A0A1N7IPC1_9PROT|nr:adenylate/guanylate cyclase domain-containing protein [Insolitispirillum peregrinum]SIS38856.1 adenylate cyclase [Insolitispirillum peregrinum]